jgi:predicted nucleotide-binding protein (sugar kinase/HSP70/actin superfamily)
MITISSLGDVVTINGLLSESDFIFDVSKDTLDLTNFAIAVSKSDALIEVTPANLETYKALYSSISMLQEQLINYIYQIIQAFNDSYNSVFEQSDDVPF